MDGTAAIKARIGGGAQGRAGGPFRKSQRKQIPSPEIPANRSLCCDNRPISPHFPEVCRGAAASSSGLDAHPRHRRERLRRLAARSPPALGRPRRAALRPRPAARPRRARAQRSATGWRAGARSSRGDALDGEGLERALAGVEVAYYLIHSMERSARRLARVRRARADRARRTSPPRPARAGVRRIVYLGGLRAPLELA